MEENKKVSGYPLFEGMGSDRKVEGSDEHSTTGDGHPPRKGSTTGDGKDRRGSTTGDGHPGRHDKGIVEKVTDALTGENHTS